LVKYRQGDGFRMIKGKDCADCALYLLELYLKKYKISLRELLKKAYPSVKWDESYDREFAKKNTFAEGKLELSRILGDLEEYNFHKLIKEVLKTA